MIVLFMTIAIRLTVVEIPDATHNRATARSAVTTSAALLRFPTM